MSPDDESPPPMDPVVSDYPPEREEGRTGVVGEFVRKVAVAGLGALFMTEEGIRNLAGQLKLPKEMLGFILTQAEKTKGEIGRVLSDEVRRFLQSDKVREEFFKVLSGMTVEIKAELRLVPSETKTDDAAVHPKLVVSDISARRGKRSRKE